MSVVFFFFFCHCVYSGSCVVLFTCNFQVSAGRHIQIFPTVFEGLSKFGENDLPF